MSNSFKYKHILTKSFLYKEYIIKKESPSQIGKMVGCSGATVLNYLNKYNIKIRTQSEARILLNMSGINNPMYGKNKYNLTKEFLYTEYITNKKPSIQIAGEKGCSDRTVLNYLIKYNIKIRSYKEAGKGINKGINCYFYKDGRSSKTYYCKDCLKKGIKTKITRESALYGSGKCKSCSITGIHNGNWNNGSSFEPYPIGFDRILKESIRERDNHQCQICGKTQKQNNQKLSVHHIDYDKSNLNPDNLIALCKKCHNETNGDRETYIDFFQILKEIIK